MRDADAQQQVIAANTAAFSQRADAMAAQAASFQQSR
jgi:hypothetical protein